MTGNIETTLPPKAKIQAPFRIVPPDTTSLSVSPAISPYTHEMSAWKRRYCDFVILSPQQANGRSCVVLQHIGKQSSGDKLTNCYSTTLLDRPLQLYT